MGLRLRGAIVYLMSGAALGACGSSDSSSSEPGSDAGDTTSDSSTADGGKPSDASTDAGGSHPADGATTHVDSSAPPPGDGGVPKCKRGIASNVVPPAAFAHSSTTHGITWWYNWSNQSASYPAGIEFVPMIWGSGSLNAPLPAGSSYVLGFNEPNFKAQSDLTPQQAANDWPMVESNANGVGAKIVSPGVNFCGSASDTSGCSDSAVTDPYTFLKDFFTACPGCEVDHIAVHWYNCDLPSLQAYIDGNATLQGFVQFGKPIWLTEFSCDGSHTVAEQQTYMEAAIPYLEGNAHVFRYSWFSSSAIPSAQLTDTSGAPTALGTTYIGLAGDCP